MANIYDMVDTWNDGATTFTSIKMDVTDTASASGSLLLDLKVGGVTKASIDKDGNLTASLTAIDDVPIGASTPSTGAFTNITVTGTVDGRDIAEDGTKLDGIEALADVTDTANVTAAGALMDSELTDIAAVKALNQGVATTDSPSFAGATLTTADINGGTIDASVIGGTTAAAGTFTTLTASSIDYPAADGAAGQVLVTDGSGTLSFADAGSDKIEEGNSSVEVVDAGTGYVAVTVDGTETARFVDNGDFKFNSGYGSVAAAYGCRAWVNFNGTGTVAIRESGNVSSITDNGAGDYTVNFSTALVDANYAATFGGNFQGGAVFSTAGGLITEQSSGTRSTSALEIASRRKDDGDNIDTDFINVAIFR